MPVKQGQQIRRQNDRKSSRRGSQKKGKRMIKKSRGEKNCYNILGT